MSDGIAQVFGLFAAGDLGNSWNRLDSINVTVGIQEYSLDYGRTYLIFERKMSKTIGLIQDLLYSGVEVMCVTRTHPDVLAESWREANVRSIWLSESKGAQNIPPDQLARILQEVNHFLSEHQSGVIMLNGMEYLALFNDFAKVQRFLEQVNDLVMSRQAILIVPIDPLSFDQRSLARLRRFAEVVED